VLWYFWIVFGFVLGILEMLTSGFFFLSVAVGAILAGIVTLLGFSLPWQLLVLSVGILVVFFGIRPFFKNRITDPVKLGIEALIGKEGRVIERISEMEAGQIKLLGQEWKAQSTNGQEILEKMRVRVDRIEGATAYVSKMEE